MSCLAAVFTCFFKKADQSETYEETLSEASTIDILIKPVKMTNKSLYREPLHEELLDDNFSYS